MFACLRRLLPRILRKPNRLPTVAEIEAAIGIPARNWAGHCHEIASAIVDHGLAGGIAVYGDWRGEISEDGHFRRAKGRPFVHHGWVALDDGRVLDPTRWAFEGKPPYLYVGPPGEEYDEGGNLHRWATLERPPAYRAEDPAVPAEKMSFLGRVAMLNLLGCPPAITRPMLVWMANLPVDLLGDMAAAIYADIIAVGQDALIPVDNLMMVARTGKRGAKTGRWSKSQVETVRARLP